MVSRAAVVSIVAIVVPFAAPAAIAAPLCKYKVELLAPSLPEYDYCSLVGLNDNGDTVGTCIQEFGEETRAIRYRNGVTTNIGVLSGFNQGRGDGVNNHGDVVGESGVSFDPYTNNAHLWSDGVMVDLETWATFPMGDTAATDINDAGEIVGSNDYDQAVYWAEGQDAVVLPGEFPTYAHAINQLGQIAGAVGVGSGRHAARWDPGPTLVDLGEIPGYPSAEAFDIADNGLVAGTAYAAGGVRAFFYNAAADPVWTIIGTFGGTQSHAKGVTSTGLVVGYATDATGGWHGYVWRKGRMWKLDDLLASNNPLDPWQIQSAYAINEKGEILALAYSSTSTGYLLLHPLSCALTSSRACCPF